MNIPSLKKLARDNGLCRVGINLMTGDMREYYIAECWGDGIGAHNFASANGATIPEAIAKALTLVAAKRAEQMEFAA